MSQAGSVGSSGGGGSGIITIDGDSGSVTGSTVTLSGGSTGLTTSGSGTTMDIVGTLDVANGGTGDTSFTAYTVVCGGTTSTGALQHVSGVGTSGQVLTSNGPAALPTWQTASSFTPVNWNVSLSVNQSNVTGNNTEYQIPYDTVNFDSASGYNTGTHIYTIPTTGIYNLIRSDFVFGGSSSSTQMLLRYSVNGSSGPNFRNGDINPASLGLTVSGEFILSTSTVLNFTAGDTIAVFINVLNTGSNNVGVGGGTVSATFSGFRIA